MKKTLLLAITFFTVTMTFGQSLPNGGLEQWDSLGTPPRQYYQPSGNFFSTLNELITVVPPAGVGIITAFRTHDAHSGVWAVKLVSDTMQTPIGTIFIPGMLGTTKLLIAQGTIILGKPCSGGCDVKHFTGWFKYSPANGDSCKMALVVSKYNTATHHRDTIAYGDTIIKNTISAYTMFDVTIKPVNMSLVPDSMTILTVASAGFSVTNLQGGVGQVGSTLYIDDLGVEYPAGIREDLMPAMKVDLYPNPGKDIITAQLNRLVKNGILEIYSLDGKLIMKYNLMNEKNEIPVNQLPAATYYYKYTKGSQILDTGSFIIKR